MNSPSTPDSDDDDIGSWIYRTSDTAKARALATAKQELVTAVEAALQQCVGGSNTKKRTYARKKRPSPKQKKPRYKLTVRGNCNIFHYGQSGKAEPMSNTKKNSGIKKQIVSNTREKGMIAMPMKALPYQEDVIPCYSELVGPPPIVHFHYGPPPPPYDPGHYAGRGHHYYHYHHHTHEYGAPPPTHGYHQYGHPPPTDEYPPPPPTRDYGPPPPTNEYLPPPPINEYHPPPPTHTYPPPGPPRYLPPAPGYSPPPSGDYHGYYTHPSTLNTSYQ